MWSSDNWYRRIAGSHHRILEYTDRHIQFIIFLVDSQHEDHPYVGTGRKISAFISDHKSFIIFFSFVYGCLNSGKHVTPNTTHLGKPLQTEYIITQFIHATTIIFPDLFFLEIAHYYEC